MSTHTYSEMINTFSLAIQTNNHLVFPLVFIKLLYFILTLFFFLSNRNVKMLSSQRHIKRIKQESRTNGYSVLFPSVLLWSLISTIRK